MIDDRKKFIEIFSGLDRAYDIRQEITDVGVAGRSWL